MFKLVHRGVFLTVAAVASLVQVLTVTVVAGDGEWFDIAAETVACEGVAPMRCLVVNGDYFYNSIEGYEHVEGRAARIYVERRELPRYEQLADAGRYSYHVMPAPE